MICDICALLSRTGGQVSAKAGAAAKQSEKIHFIQ
jgi:hypothetical protein